MFFFLRSDLFSPLPSSPAVVGDLAGKMLGFNLTTKQTSEEGVKVKTVSQSVDRRHRVCANVLPFECSRAALVTDFTDLSRK